MKHYGLTLESEPKFEKVTDLNSYYSAISIRLPFRRLNNSIGDPYKPPFSTAFLTFPTTSFEMEVANRAIIEFVRN